MPLHSQQHQQHRPAGSGLQQRQSAADTPSHSDCCSDNAVSPHQASVGGAAQTEYPKSSGFVQSGWRLQQEHQSLAPASLPAPQIMQPSHIKNAQRNKAAVPQSTETVPSRADFSWPMAVMAASLPSKQIFLPAAPARKHTSELPQEMAHALAQTASAAGQPGLYDFNETMHASQQSRDTLAAEFLHKQQQQQQQQRHAPEQRKSQQQQHKAHPVAADTSEQNSAAPSADSGQQQQQLQRHEQRQQQKQQKAKFVAVHGNYHRYYGTRRVADFEADPRLKVFPRQILAHTHHIESCLLTSGM